MRDSNFQTILLISFVNLHEKWNAKVIYGDIDN